MSRDTAKATARSVASGRRGLVVGIVQLPHAEGLPLPAYQSDEAAGLDLVAAVGEDAPITLAPGERRLVPTGLIVELPKGTEAQVRPRSGLAMKHGVTVLNSPGTIDSDYRGEVGVLLINLGDEPFVIRRGERIAQMVVAEVARAQLRPETKLSATSRGAGGFGSTGTVAPTVEAGSPAKAAGAKTRAKTTPAPSAKGAGKTRPKRS